MPPAEDTGRVIRQEIARLARTGLPFDRDDAHQDAWVAALEAWATWRPNGAPWTAYVRMAVRRAIGRGASRALAVTRCADHALENGEAARQTRRGIEQDGWVGWDGHYSLEAALLGIEADVLRAAWLRQVRDEIGQMVAHLAPELRPPAHALLAGGKAAAVAGRLGVERAVVYQAAARLKHHVRHSAVLAALWGVRP